MPPASEFADLALVLRGFAFEHARRAARLPSLERLLIYSREGLRKTEADAALEAWQCETLQALRLQEIAAYPSAPLSWLGAGERRASGTWLHAQPVVLAMSTQGLSLQIARPELQLDWSEVEGALRAHLAESDWSLHIKNRTPFLHSQAALEVQTSSPQYAAAEELRSALPKGRDAIQLRRLMTDLQMLLHGSAADGAFNSLWLWGAGEIPAASKRDLPPIWTDQDYVRGIYALHDGGDSCHPRPASAAQIAPWRVPLVVVLGEMDLEQIESHWFAPIARAIDGGKIRSLELYLDGVQARMEYSRYRRWFARPRPLMALSA